MKGDEVSPGRLPAPVWELNPQKPKEPRLQPQTRHIFTLGVCGASRREIGKDSWPIGPDAPFGERLALWASVKNTKYPYLQP